MRVTYQAIIDSGSWGAPEATDVHHGTKGDAESLLDYWVHQNAAVGGSKEEVYLLAFSGKHEDVTDMYPDYKVSFGPRSGVRWERL